MSVLELINEGVHRLVASPEFVSWRQGETLGPGDIVLINNSFVFRDVKTNKAASCLALILRDPPTEYDIAVALDVRFNLDFKRIAAASLRPPALLPLNRAIQEQTSELGHLVFLLIGEVHDTEVVQTKLDCAGYDVATWDPAIAEVVRVETTRIVVSRTDDEDVIWNAVAEQLIGKGEDASPQLRVALGIALDHLQDQAVARVVIPLPGQNIGFGITDSILVVLREQRDEYAEAVTRYSSGGPQAPGALNDVLRIAYNFASDATSFIRLIVQVCDLKPIVLWGTIAEQYALSSSFHALPWSRSKPKPSLKNYELAISDARNSAFHNLFPFRKSLRVALPDNALGAPELQIFSEHGKKKENELTYKDKELVDVLVEFTRARERALSLSFWQRNLTVMNSTVTLFERTSQFVKELASARTA
jgi:hypothetical protein